MKQSSIVAIVAFAIAAFCMVSADLSEERVSDAWADFYKSYYEEHAGAEDRDLGIGHHHHSSGYSSPPAPVAAYDSPQFVPYPSTSYSYGDSFKSIDFSAPETAVSCNILSIIFNITI